MAKPITKSNTTQNVMIGGVGLGVLIKAGMELFRLAIGDWLPWPPDNDDSIVMVGTVLLTPFVSRWLAFQSDNTKLYRHGAPMILFFLAPALLLQGCVTGLPAFGGRTVNEVKLVATPDGGYDYSNKKKIPGGVEDTRLDRMEASVDPEGNWSISVAGDQSTSTTAQAAMVAEVSRQQMEAFERGIGAVLNALAPYIGQYLDARVREGEIKAGVANNAIDRLSLPTNE